MSVSLPPVLVVDDEKNMRLSLQTILGDEGYQVEAVDSAEEALKQLQRDSFFMMVADAYLGGMSGYDLLKETRRRWPNVPVLVITAYATPKLAAEAIKAGAIDYLSKPFAPEELLHAVARCAERYRLMQENASLRARATEPYRLEQIIGDSPRMQELRKLIQTVAPSNATVLILGESGTGKELIAGAIHTLSHRAPANYVRINCAAIPETLLESELFGHEKGSFTGALKRKPGRVEEADSGTIFLDEIGDMSRPLQAKLLRFLEDGTFSRIGGTEEHRVNVRVIAATNHDLKRAIDGGRFREDLFHRLNVVQLRPPPLRERGRDVVVLAEHFLKSFNVAMKKNIRGITPEAQQKLVAHDWPGNVRELRNAIERAVILEHGADLQASSLPDFWFEERLHKSASAKPPNEASLDDLVADAERQLISNLLEKNHFNLNRTAEMFKITRHSLRYRMQRLNIPSPLAGDDSAAGKDGG